MSVLDADLTKELAEEGMARASASVSDTWKTLARGCIVTASEKWSAFSADQVWVEMAECGLDTTNGSALGPIFRELAKEGLIVSTGEFVRSTRPATHGKPLPTWRKAT